MPPMTKSKKALASQEFLAIDSIREDVVVLTKNQGLRAVLMVSSLNFALKSEEEQDAIIFAYENFLNALDFSIQFVISSRRLNIQPYLDVLASRQKEESNELLKIQIGEYIEFIRTFVDLTQIVAKTFYVVVPFQPSIAERRGGMLKGLAGLWGGAGRPPPAEEEGGDEFLREKSQLTQRVDTVIDGLRRFGLRIAPLNTEELIELFYGLYNPTESQKTSEPKS